MGVAVGRDALPTPPFKRRWVSMSGGILRVSGNGKCLLYIWPKSNLSILE
jgi:hypothetical protein